MFMNLQINRTLVKNSPSMDSSSKTVSSEAMQLEWEEIKAAQKNPALFRPIYTRYFENIFRYIYRRTADEQLSADICSQVFLKALQRLGKYQFKNVPFSAWLYRIASNEIAQHYRNTKKKRVVSLEESNIGEMLEELNPNDFEKQKQLRTAFIDTLNELKPTDMELIEMRFFEQRSFKEIAAILDLSESNAKVRTYRILARMKKIILKKM